VLEELLGVGEIVQETVHRPADRTGVEKSMVEAGMS
jgi:hypothetical protein